MADKIQDMEFRLREYLSRRGYSLSWRQLGAGADGTVITTMRNPEVNSAVKVFGYSEQFLHELAVYERLAENNLRSIDGLEGLNVWGLDRFDIPELFDADRELLIIEISIVTPPYILDFASAYLDAPPARYSDKEFVAAWHAEA